MEQMENEFSFLAYKNQSYKFIIIKWFGISKKILWRAILVILFFKYFVRSLLQIFFQISTYFRGTRGEAYS